MVNVNCDTWCIKLFLKILILIANCTLQTTQLIINRFDCSIKMIEHDNILS